MLPDHQFQAGKASVAYFSDRGALARAAAHKSADLIRQAVSRQGSARVLLATGNSQTALMAELMALPEIPWARVEAFHLDEYVGIDARHPASFRRWIRERFEQRCSARRVHYIQGDALDLEAELARYAALLMAGPIDLAFVGFGENGHIAFNDPGVAAFNDPLVVKVVNLDEASIAQQVGEGHFADRGTVPRRAVTVTCTTLARARAWVCSVPELRKAQAVHDALTGPVSESCPASLVQQHPQAFVFIDAQSGSRLRARMQPVHPA